MKLPVSGCVITLNEERHIADCIKSLDFCDEILVVDSHSTDRTTHIAESLGAKVFQFDSADLVKKQNYTLELAANQWIFTLDADERVSEELKNEIQRLFRHTPGHDGYRFPRRTYYIDKWIRHGGWYPDKKIRLYDKTKAVWTGVNPHYEIRLKGSAGDIHADILHYSFDNVQAHVDRLKRYAAIAVEQMADNKATNGVIPRMIIRPAGKFLEMYIYKLGFLDGKHGFIIAGLYSFGMFVRYALLFEHMRKNRIPAQGKEHKK
ncbi:MAG: glycosyltransferase [Chitinivibrionales bacterium]|nr:glycosyltransferase [Chitinivibrionales bacterium]